MSKLRILLITENDPLYVIRFFEAFFERYPRDEFEICGITVANAFHEPLWKTAKRMLAFYGPADFALLLLRFTLVTLRGKSFKSLAERHGVPVLPTSSVNDPAYVEKVRAINPDVIVSVAAPELFRKGILAAARILCLNIHSGRLPQYRGMMPNFWQLLHGESYATITVHEMVEKLDAGPVLGTLEFPLRERDSLDRVIAQTKRAGASLMIDVLRAVAAGTTAPVPLDMARAAYYRFPTSKDVREFRKRGHRML
jgi:methionyl-tRNA formyltransferase